MALTNCKECGGQVSKKATKCPHCGIKLRKGGNNGCLWTFIIVALAFVAISIFSPDLDTSSEISHPNNFLAYNYAEDAVKKKLKAPSTAKFPRTTEKDKHIKYLGNKEYQIDSWVDSQNSFGAMIRTNFSVTIVFDNEKVSFKNLKIE